MSFLALLPDEVDVQRFTPSGSDDLGDSTGIWASITGSPSPARVEERWRDENRDGKQVSFRRLIAYVPATLAALQTDRVVYGGKTHHIVAIDDVWGRAAIHHRVLTLEVAT